MKVISEGLTFTIHRDNIKTYDALPPDFYEVRFGPMTGYSLLKVPPMTITEKVYGSHNQKIRKSLDLFKRSQRNTGIILSGDKGIGKSFFAKNLSIQCVKEGYPVIIVNQSTPSLVSFLNSIEQEVVILFDEFDKTFSIRNNEQLPTTQEEMLSMLDGMSTGKKLFVVTCNNLYDLSEFIVNRPGRFHYHFRFNCPETIAVEEYLTDQISPEFHSEIPAIVEFTQKVRLSYDCLRAIVTEVNMGIPFKEAITDLNIMNTETPEYDVHLFFEDGTYLTRREVDIDLFGEEPIGISMESKGGWSMCTVQFNPIEVTHSSSARGIIVPAKALNIKWRLPLKEEDYSEGHAERVNSEIDTYKSKTPAYLQMVLTKQSSMHYVL